MASVAFSAERILPIRERAILPVAKAQLKRAVQWPRHEIADAASGLAFLGVLGWAVWHLGVHLNQMLGTMEAQAAATGMGGLF